MAEGEFEMKEHDKQIETKLKNLGDLLRTQSSVTKKGMHKIEQLEEAKSFKHVNLIPRLVQSGLGIAA